MPPRSRSELATSSNLLRMYGFDQGWQGYGNDHLTGAAPNVMEQDLDEPRADAYAVKNYHMHGVWTEYPVPCDSFSRSCGSEGTLELVRDAPRPFVFGIGLGSGFVLGWGGEYVRYLVMDTNGDVGFLKAPAVRTGPLGSIALAIGADAGLYVFGGHGAAPELAGEFGAYNIGLGPTTLAVDMNFQTVGASGMKLGWGGALGLYATSGTATYTPWSLDPKIAPVYFP